MSLSELIARGERYVDMVREFKRGANAVADAAPKAAHVTAEAVQALGRKNAELKREVAALRLQETEFLEAWGKLQVMESQATDRVKELEAALRAQLAERPTRNVTKLHEKIHDLERQVEAHRETIRGYFEKLDAEAHKGNPNGKIAPANSDR